MIDLRSDTITKPCSNMLEAMLKANVGDDVYGEDPTVKQLEKKYVIFLEQKCQCFFPLEPWQIKQRSNYTPCQVIKS